MRHFGGRVHRPAPRPHRGGDIDPARYGASSPGQALGGTLLQHLADHPAHFDPAGATSHRVSVRPHSLLSRITGAADLTVNFLHQQAVLAHKSAHFALFAWLVGTAATFAAARAAA